MSLHCVCESVCVHSASVKTDFRDAIHLLLFGGHFVYTTSAIFFFFSQ